MLLLVLFQNVWAAVLTPLFIFTNTAFIVILLYIEVGKYNKSTVSDRMAGYTTAVDLGAALGPLTLIFLDFGLNVYLLYSLAAGLLVISGFLHNVYFTKE
jgi:hypothetical protein